MVCTSIYSFLALEGNYLELATSLHPIEAEGYEIHPDFTSLVRELNFAGGLDENPYKHLQDFEELCVTLMKSGLIQLTALGIGSENNIEDPTPFPLSIKEDCFDNDIENTSKAPTYDLKGLKFKPAGLDLEEFMASKENLLVLSGIISRNLSTSVEEDGSYIPIYPDSKTICCCLQGFLF
jgi:hypothetical protein